MKQKTKYVTTTGLLIAVTVVFQSLSKFVPLGPFGNIITGSLVNACLLISTSLVGLWGGTIVGLFTPFCAILTGSAIPVLFTPFIALGNFSLVFSYSRIKKNGLLRLGVPAAIKTLWLYLSICAMLGVMKLPDAKAAMMLYLFSWPQFITAILGGLLAWMAQIRLPANFAKSGKPL